VLPDSQTVRPLGMYEIRRGKGGGMAERERWGKTTRKKGRDKANTIRREEKKKETINNKSPLEEGEEKKKKKNGLRPFLPRGEGGHKTGNPEESGKKKEKKNFGGNGARIGWEMESGHPGRCAQE